MCSDMRNITWSDLQLVGKLENIPVNGELARTLKWISDMRGARLRLLWNNFSWNNRPLIPCILDLCKIHVSFNKTPFVAEYIPRNGPFPVDIKWQLSYIYVSFEREWDLRSYIIINLKAWEKFRVQQDLNPWLESQRSWWPLWFQCRHTTTEL